MRSKARWRASFTVMAAAAVLGSVACAPSADEQRLPAEQLMAGIRQLPTATAASLVATFAFSDPGVAEGIHMVKVRILDRITLRLRLETAADVVFAEDPRLCLVGPNSAPDDAGLEDRCWGEPDLTALAAGLWPRNAANQPMLTTREPLGLWVQLERGTKRCDYPPGGWTVEFKARPIVHGSPMEAMWAPDGAFQIPIGSVEPLPYLNDNTRYCGLASLDDGEPETYESPP